MGKLTLDILKKACYTIIVIKEETKMTVFVTKADSDYWYEIKVFNTMEDIQRFIRFLIS